MTIHLSKELEQFVHNAVQAGRYATEDDVVNDALTRLKQEMPRDIEMADQNANGAKASEEKLLIERAQSAITGGRPCHSAP